MTKEETLKAIKVMQDFVDGKTIEWFNEDHWETITDPCWEWDEDNPQYRVKPEPHYRPFESADEVMEAIREHGGWLDASVGGKANISEFNNAYIWIGAGGKGISFKDAFINYRFEKDGTPFGKLEE